MQTITTTYHGPTNTRGSRIKATASGSRGYIFHGIDNSMSIEENHRAACLALMAGMKWSGIMIGGDTKAGMVWVFSAESANPLRVADPAGSE